MFRVIYVIYLAEYLRIFLLCLLKVIVDRLTKSLDYCIDRCGVQFFCFAFNILCLVANFNCLFDRTFQGRR
jgi:hypothetical protein